MAMIIKQGSSSTEKFPEKLFFPVLFRPIEFIKCRLHDILGHCWLIEMVWKIVEYSKNNEMTEEIKYPRK